MPFFIAPLISAGAYFGLDFLSNTYKEQQEKEKRRKFWIIGGIILIFVFLLRKGIIR